MAQIYEKIDRLTRSIENAITGERFLTDVLPVKAAEIVPSDWVFDWKSELRVKHKSVKKLVTRGNETVLQGLISYFDNQDHLYIDLIESAAFNKGKNKLYVGVAGNLFAYVCRQSFESGYDGFVVFTAKTALVNHYQLSLKAKILSHNRMYLDTQAALFLLKHYYNET